MSTIQPTPPSENNPLTGASPSSSSSGKPGSIENRVDEAVSASWWGGNYNPMNWNWKAQIWGAKKNEDGVEDDQESSSEEKSDSGVSNVVSEDGGSASSSGAVINTEDDESENPQNLGDGEKHQNPDANGILVKTIVREEADTSSVSIEEEDNVESDEISPEITAEKTQEATSTRLWSALTTITAAVNKVVSGVKTGTVTALKKGTEAYVDSYAKSLDKQTPIKEAYAKIQAAGAGSEYIAFSQFVTKLLYKPITDLIPPSINIEPQIVKDLLDINLAVAFSNLVVMVKKDQNLIQNFDDQPALVNILSLFAQKASVHVTESKMAAIEEKYREHRVKHAELIKEIFPNISNEPEKQALLNQWANGTLQGSINDSPLFPEFVGYKWGEPDPTSELGQRWNQVFMLRTSMDREVERRRELKEIFKPVIDDIIKYALPNKTDDLVIPGFMKTISKLSIGGRSIEGFIYSLLTDALTDLLVEAYNPLENDLTLKQEREKAIIDRVGEVNIEGLIDAPAALLLNLSKTFIQTDPKVISLVEDILNTSSASQQREGNVEILSRCSQEQLAGWIVESIQVMLHTQDPNLIKAGSVVQGILRNLTLSLLSQGAELVIPEGQRVDENKFVAELVERIIEKFKTIKEGNFISDEAWKSFARQLPLPSVLIENLLIPQLIEKAKSLQATLQGMNPNFEQLQTLYDETIAKVNDYQEGTELLEISRALTNQIVDTALSRNLDLIDATGLGSELEELLNDYLPGVKFDETLIQWFKNNVTALSASSAEESESVSLLKRGVQAVILKAMINTIESNFQDNSTNYASQLFSNIHQAFKKAFPELNPEQIQEMRQALEIQDSINENRVEIERLQTLIASKPVGITPEQLTLVQNVIQAHKKVVRSEHEIKILEGQTDKAFEKLNQTGRAVWDRSKLTSVKGALAYRQSIEEQIQQEKATQSLTTDLAALQYLKLKIDDKITSTPGLDLSQLQELQQQQSHLSMLISLLSLPTEELKLVSEALTIQKTLQNARKEHSYLLEDLKAKEFALKQEVPSINQDAWDLAVNQMNQILDAVGVVKQLKERELRLLEELDTHLTMFQTLANELSGLVGLDKKEKLDLPDTLKEMVWPYLEQAKGKQLGRLVFTQLSPMILTVLEAETNREKLSSMGEGSDLLAKISKMAAETLVEHIPQLITSYKPFANKILKIGKVDNPSDEQVVAMERALNEEMLKQGSTLLNLDLLKQSLKSQIPADEIDRVSQRLLGLRDGTVSLSEENIRSILLEDGRIDEAHLDKKSKELISELRHQLIQLGKQQLNVELIIAVFEKVSNQTLSEEAKLEMSSTLENAKIVEQIKMVQITPERLAELLNEAIPGASSLHTLIAPQIQEILSGQGTVFQGSWDVVERYVEGALLKVFVKIAEANENSLAVIGEKLNDFMQDPSLIEGYTKEESAKLIIDRILKDILDLKAERDIPGIPLAVQSMAYKILKEQAYQQLAPLVLPIIEKEQNKEALRRMSGSKILGNLANAFSKDIFRVLPSVFRSLQPTANRIFIDLAGRQPTSNELNQFTKKIAELTEHAREQVITNKALVDAYLNTTHLELDSEEEFTHLIHIIEQKRYRDQLFIQLEELFEVLMTPEQVVGSLQSAIPQMGTIAQELASRLQAMTRMDHPVYQNLSGFTSNYIESMMLRLFIKIAEKNPPTRGKDSLIVLTENLLGVVERKYQEAKTKPIDVIAQELNDEVFKEILGIDSEDAFEGVPEPVKALIYHAIKDQLKELVLQIHQSVVESANQQNHAASGSKEALKKYGIDAQTGRAYADIIAEDISKEVLKAIPSIVNEAGPQGNRLLNKAMVGIGDYLEDLAKANFEVARVLLNYSKAPVFKDLVGNNVARVTSPDTIVEEKEKVASLVGHLILGNMHKLFDRVVKFEEQKGAQFNRDLIGNLLQIVGKHVRQYNQAEKLAKEQGKKSFSHADFVQVAGVNWHPAVPTQAINYDASVAEINRRLNGILTLEEQKQLKIALAEMVALQKKGDGIFTVKELIDTIERIRKVPEQAPELSRARKQTLRKIIDGRSIKDFVYQDARAIEEQRKMHFQDPATKTLMKMLFPGGKKDLANLGIPEHMRLTAWKLMKTDVFPIAIQTIVKTALDEANIKTMISSALKSAQETLEGEIVLDSSIPDDPSKDKLDDASGELIGAMLEMIELPAVLKNRLRDKKTGEVSSALKQAIGASLRKQFNGNFIEDALKSALKSAAQRDPVTGEPTITIDTSSEESKKLKREEKIAELDLKIQQQVYDVVDTSVSYAIKNLWVKAQAKFDQLVLKAFGKIGLKLKQALDSIFRFIFFKLIGTALEFIYDKTMLKALIKKMFHSLLSLDANRQKILDFLTHTPDNQPIGSHPLHLEALGYNLARAVRLSVEEALRGGHSSIVENDVDIPPGLFQ